MKKLISAAIASLCLIASAFSAPKAPVLKPIDIDVVCEKGEYNDFVVDPRIEIIAIACRLAEMQGFTNVYGSGDELIGQTVTLYEKYKTHKAVNTIKSLMKKEISNDAMISLAYHIKPDFSGTIIDFSPFPETLHFEWKKIPVKTIYTLITQLHDLAVESNFQRLYTMNRSTYLLDIGYMKERLEKIQFSQWAEDFFKDEEIQHPVITMSRLCCSFSYYDFAKGSDGKRLSYLTTYSGVDLYSVEMCYMDFYTQLYASRNWETVKDNFLKYDRDYAMKMASDKKEAEKNYKTPSDYEFAILLSAISYALFLKDNGDEAEISYEEYVGAIEKSLAEPNFMKIFPLLEEYSADREKYPTFQDFAPRLNEFINALTVSE
ncbi:MAG: DUF4932 domain-containing protein [Treponema sp.]|nr:DUF4932 domain-containing protein [Treponema sp.]